MLTDPNRLRRENCPPKLASNCTSEGALSQQSFNLEPTSISQMLTDPNRLRREKMSAVLSAVARRAKAEANYQLHQRRRAVTTKHGTTANFNPTETDQTKRLRSKSYPP
jgi:hypothetical protein